MRISDWSSDVCSSDLKQLISDAPGRMTARMDMDSKQQENAEAGSTYGVSTVIERLARHLALACPDEADDGAEGLPAWHGQVEHAATILALMKEPDEALAREGDRSEAQTSELQSLMRQSY